MHASSGLISAFSASSSMGVRSSTPHSASLKMPESNPLEAKESDKRPLPCPARRLNDVYRAYTERKATQQDTQTALS